SRALRFNGEAEVKRVEDMMWKKDGICESVVVLLEGGNYIP
ncbi:hypothetical protein Tco_1330346, partial [Tanacetum coccineum]